MARLFNTLSLTSLAMVWLAVPTAQFAGAELAYLNTWPNIPITIILIAVSFGLCFPSKASLYGWVAAILAINLLSVSSLGDFGVRPLLPSGTITVVFSICLTILFCVSCGFAFFKLSQIVALEVQSRSPRDSLRSMTLGTLLGAGGLFALSAMNVHGPWLLIPVPLLLPIKPRLYLCLLALVFHTELMSCSHFIYSPYRKIELRPVTGATLVIGNGILFQSCMAIPKKTKLDELASTKSVLDEVNQFKHYLGRLSVPMVAAPNKNDVLILGSGCGNDVSFALKYGAGKIDAVELDPALINIGRTVHPDKPYANPNVTVYNADPRRFLAQTNKKYDLIEFAFINEGRSSHTYYDLGSDSFIYTVECMESALTKLKTRGVIAISYACPQNAVSTQRLLSTVTSASACTFAMKQHDYDVYDLAPQYSFFMLGPAVKSYDKTTFTPKITRFIYLSRLEGNRADLACSDSCPFPNLDKENGDTLPTRYVFLILLIATGLAYNCNKKLGSGSKLSYIAVGAFWAASNYVFYSTSMLWLGAFWHLPLLVLAVNSVLLLLSTLIPDRMLSSKFFSPTIFVLTLCGIIGIVQINDLALLALNALVLTLFATLLFLRQFNNSSAREIVLGLTFCGYSLGLVCSLLSISLGTRQIVTATLSAIVSFFCGKRKVESDSNTTE